MQVKWLPYGGVVPVGLSAATLDSSFLLRQQRWLSHWVPVYTCGCLGPSRSSPGCCGYLGNEPQVEPQVEGSLSAVSSGFLIMSISSVRNFLISVSGFPPCLLSDSYDSHVLFKNEPCAMQLTKSHFLFESPDKNILRSLGKYFSQDHEQRKGKAIE